MSNESATIVQKLWNFCNVLRDDGVSYGDYVEQLTYLLFLKLADESTKPPLNKPSTIPAELDWESLLKERGAALETQYVKILRELSTQKGLLGVIFRKSQNRIQTPANLQRLIHLINDETWSGMTADIKGTIYEGLLQKNAEDTKSGAGQYFTPRPLIKAMVTVMRPLPMRTVCDPACGTGGFFLAAYNYISENYNLTREQKAFLRFKTFAGTDIVDNVVRLCVMNLYLHGIGGTESPITTDDSLRSATKDRYDMVLTNPPFGNRSSITIATDGSKQKNTASTYEREDFWATTSNKQFNFLQHIKTILKTDGRAAVVLPDNVLFERGAGETIRRQLLKQFDVHTLLRLPTGIFYAQGVKANVLFFDKRPARAEPWTQKLWIYDLRTDKRFTLKTNPLRDADLQDFITRYNPKNRYERVETERFRAFNYEELVQREHANLDIFWLKEDSLEDAADLPAPDVLVAEITKNLEAALTQFQSIQNELDDND
ncbi:SAM-dependent DNA methyltransferase [Candidatus Poribacteria bacterium]|nr:SAM-dependent DNA methyltransferase [Candidatus Poribacteria bacterium]MYA55464.1 SAM-dependent DNA methyltransferase [Candidatus Poribacteria bacterium]